MNAAARLVHQGVLSRHLVFTHFLTKRQLFALMLMLMSVASALGIIYTTYTHRVLYAAYERNTIEQQRLHAEHSQLLLERSTLIMQSRVQQIAEKNLQMRLPDNQSVVIINE